MGAIKAEKTEKEIFAEWLETEKKKGLVDFKANLSAFNYLDSSEAIYGMINSMNSSEYVPYEENFSDEERIDLGEVAL